MSSSPPALPETLPRKRSRLVEFAPFLVVTGSATLAAALANLSEALRWNQPDGFKLGLGFGMAFALPLLVVLLAIQGVLALLLMSRGRRNWWRILAVAGPAALLIALSLRSIVGLYPPEKRARRELPHHLGGPIPASATDLTIKFSGGMDPSWFFSFQISPEDYKTVSRYRSYGPAQSESPEMVWLQFPAEGYPNQSSATVYYLGYDAAKSRCVLSSVNF